MSDWKTAPISPTCECIGSTRPDGGFNFCGATTSYAYPASGGGWMALCHRHGIKHLPQIKTIENLITGGETFEGAAEFQTH